MKKYLFISLILPLIAACTNVKAQQGAESETMQNELKSNEIPGPEVEITTTLGNIIVKLYDDTPLHRDNFLKLVEEGFYKDILFHRVINQFMVQAGDPGSKTAQPGDMLGAGSPEYTVEAEIDYPKHYHKYGALAAARTPDQVNPERRSSSSQFYIVTGKVYTPDQLNAMQGQSVMSRRQGLFNTLSMEYADSIRAWQASGETDKLNGLRDELIKRVENEIPDEQMPANIAADYSSIGGTPNLDGQYTVFGEVISGMDVVEKIQKMETDRYDRPLEDVRILSVKVLKK